MGHLVPTSHQRYEVRYFHSYHYSSGEKNSVEELAHQCTGTEKPGSRGHPQSPTVQPCAGGGAGKGGGEGLFCC